MAHQQRFCPICDRSFEEGEAILRCEGCDVLHHPACWVRNDGCATSNDHPSSPVAEAYTTIRTPIPPPPRSAPAPQPPQGEVPPRSRFMGQRYNREGEVPRPVLRRQQQEQPMIGADDDFEEGIVITQPGKEGPPGDERTVRRPAPPRRYENEGEPPPRKPLPKVYGRPRILDYWYVPVAVLLAVGVALGVIFAVDQITGSDDQPAAPTLPAGGGADNSSPAATQPPSETATPPAAPPPSGTFSVGQTVVVTGSGECLNVRPAPGLDAGNEPVACLPDGSQLLVTGGPQSVGGLTWWNVESDQGDGWAAEDYLSATP